MLEWHMKILWTFARYDVCPCVTSALVLLPGSSGLYCARHTWLCQVPMYASTEKKSRVEILNWEVGKPVRIPFKTFTPGRFRQKQSAYDGVRERCVKDTPCTVFLEDCLLCIMRNIDLMNLSAMALTAVSCLLEVKHIIVIQHFEEHFAFVLYYCIASFIVLLSSLSRGASCHLRKLILLSHFVTVQGGKKLEPPVYQQKIYSIILP